MQSVPDTRLSALCALLRTLGPRGERLTTLHPHADALRSAPATCERLDALWWAELDHLEARAHVVRAQTAGLRSSANYYLRRRDLARWSRWRSVAAQLDRTWRALLDWPAPRAREACIQLGLRACAASAASVARYELPLWLRPLGAQRAHEVLEQLIHTPPPPLPALSAQVGKALNELGRERRGDSLLSALGRRILAARLRANVDLALIDATGVGGSDLLRLLRNETPLHIETAGEARTVDGWIEHLTR